MQNILKICLSPAVYILSTVAPKKYNKWCFGSWFGNSYTDNPKYIFERFLLDSNIEAIWITNNDEVFNLLRGRDIRCYKAWSTLGIYHQITSKFFLSNVNSKDFAFPTITRRNIFIHTTHGAPLKKIGFDIPMSFISKNINIVRHFLIDNYDLVISPSAGFNESFSSALNVSFEKIINIQNARCDAFKIKPARKHDIKEQLSIKAEKLILYLPTHRNEGEDVDTIERSLVELNNYKDLFIGNNIAIFLKLHPYDQRHLGKLKKVSNYVRIVEEVHMSKIDLYELLAASDGLITDYSSVMFEYAELEKPIYHFVPDLKDYCQRQRGLYVDFESVVNAKLATVPELVEALISANPEEYSDVIESKYRSSSGKYGKLADETYMTLIGRFY